MNLAKIGATVSAQAEAVPGASQSTASTAIAKILMMFVFVVGLYIYESITIDEVTRKYQSVLAEMSSVDEEISQFGSVTGVVEDLDKERKSLKAQIKVIEKISKKRAFKLSSITALQEAIPDDCWLETITVEAGQVIFEGYARQTTSALSIVDKLKALDYIEDASNQGFTRQKLGITNVQKFKIIARVRE
ncbi:MAG: PilN domain-containing protein [Bdellovibrionales bacterium]|nr:PilN domain-containing protein [Bdellovibrionales bacterium]